MASSVQRVESLKVTLHRLPPASTWIDATHKIEHLEFVLVEIRAGDQTGVRWTYTLGHGGLAIRALIQDAVQPRVVGADAMNLDSLLDEVWWTLHPLGRGGISSLAVAAIDVALWDLRGQALGKPVYEMFGRQRRRIDVYASGIDLHLDPTALGELLAGYLARGYRAVKIKVGDPDPARDLARVRAARERIGPDVRLIRDANQKWSGDQGAERATLYEPYSPFWLEEPCRADDVEGHARVRAATRIPIATGETLFTREQFAMFFERQALDIVEADVARVGGVREWLAIARMARERGLKMAPHFLVELSVPVLCAIPNGLIAEYVMGGTLSDLGLLAEPLVPRDGFISPPEAAGHGVRFDRGALARYALRD